jgi:conjugative relaxase-like TrwC/TraI family protein/excisionase family DNA binding protein
MTTSSIAAAKGGGYARYLEGKTVQPERGDYYLTRGGEPAQAPGRWLASPETLAQLGIDGSVVDGPAFVALMEGRHPQTGRWLRPEGAGGGRGGGIDLTLSAPKSVSAVWALGDDAQRRDMEAAHAAAVQEAVGYLTEMVPTVRRRYGGQVVEEPAREVVAAEYLHTTARGVMDGDAPDPQLHSHVVVTSAVRDDGRIVAVASRPIFRSAREVGAFYRSALAHQLTQRGYAIDAGTGNHGRYFEIAGVPRGLLEAFSARSREVARAAERFRARYGRAPERGELRRVKLENRKAKIPVTRADLQQVWGEKAARFGFTGEQTDVLLDAARGSRPERAIEDRVEERLTERAATFEPGELRAVLLEQSVGELSPQEAVARSRAMIAERRILPLEGGRMTTLAVRAKEQAIERRIAQLAKPADREVGESAREIAAEQVSDRIGGQLSDEQTHALQIITGPERAAVLIGPAGTGKGVVIDAAARAEQLTGRETVGVAVSWSTTERLGRDSPALVGQTFSVDALVARVEHGRVEIGKDTTVYFDEAGMADTPRLGQLSEMVERTGAKLVAIGDGAQLPSIGAGGMFDRLSQLAPSVTLSDVRRTMDPAEQRAWADLRAGRSDRAMAHYLAKHRLHMAATRDQAVEQAVHDWAKLTEAHPINEIALISDASNKEIDRLNARAQHYRAQRGELGDLEAEIPGIHYGIRKGDRIALIEPHHERGKQRIENGSRGEVLDITPAGEALIEFDLTGQRRTLASDDLAQLRLAYAQHIHRAQGATVTRTLVVTGGWQTSKEPAYVEASRARTGTDWYVNRDDLGTEGHDTDRIKRLAHNMSRSHAQTPSLAHPELPDPESGPGLHIPRTPAAASCPASPERFTASPNHHRHRSEHDDRAQFDGRHSRLVVGNSMREQSQQPASAVDTINPAETDGLLTAEEVASLLQVTPAWVYAETRRRRIPHIRLGRYVRYRRFALQAWMDDMERSSTGRQSQRAR